MTRVLGKECVHKMPHEPRSSYRILIIPVVNMSKSIAIPDEVVVSKIYLIRNHKVMLDLDLAELYQVDTGRLNEQVKRNAVRFPEDFMFQLTIEE